MKSAIRFSLILIVLALFIRYGAPVKQSVNRWINFSFCDRPIKYKLGSIDPKFNVTNEYFLNAISSASGIWNTGYGKTLFEHDSNGALTINLVYDGRQEIVNDINSMDKNVNTQKENLDAEHQNYEAERTQLEKDIKQLNDEIGEWNSKGGAPEEEYEKIISRQKELQRRTDELNKKANNINNKVENVNSQVGQLNKSVGTFNSILQVNPEIGVYTSGINKIDIFFFGSQDELVHVLAHELGHALGLGHVSDANAIMDPSASSLLKLNPSDLSELKNVCENKNRVDLIKNDVVNAVYSLISKYFSQ